MADLGVKVKVNMKRLEALQNGLGPKAGAVLDKTAIDVEAGAKERAPVDTGALRSSLHTEKPDTFKRIIADGVNYGVFNEYGTHKMGARPFLTPAVEIVRKPFAKAWEALFK